MHITDGWGEDRNKHNITLSPSISSAVIAPPEKRSKVSKLSKDKLADG
jgi:hypothetical protein